MKITGWGNYPVIESTSASPSGELRLREVMAAAASAIAYGLGRSYGDSALNPELTVCSSHMNMMLNFDESEQVLTAEAGVSLAEIVDVFLPRGYFVPVTPGTKFITLGGAIASDVHGKNHHVAGTFARHVLWMDIWTPSAGVVRCSEDSNQDLFYASCGGQGLTGFIVRAAIRLERVPSAHISQTTVKAKNLTEIMDIFDKYAELPYSVAWIDCLKSGQGLGRSVFMGGDFAAIDELPRKLGESPFSVESKMRLTVPFNFPSFVLNGLTTKTFNAFYYGKAPNGSSSSIVDYNTFFYPLDSIHNWNRIYGRRGFIQYQFVIPQSAAAEGLPKILRRIVEAGQGSFLAVLKLFGSQPEHWGNLSFPCRGYTLALDFPVGHRLFPLLDELDRMVINYGGRHYLSKDARLSPEVFGESYGARPDEFKVIKKKWDPDNIFRSMQSDRLHLTTSRG